MRGALCVVLAALAASCGGEDEPRVLTVRMEEESGSTQFGEAVLTEIDGSRTRIEISVGVGGADSTQPARIYRGSCDALSAEPAYALEDVVDGESATEIEVPLDDLLASGYVVSVHETPALLRIRAACGEIPRVD